MRTEDKQAPCLEGQKEARPLLLAPRPVALQVHALGPGQRCRRRGGGRAGGRTLLLAFWGPGQL